MAETPRDRIAKHFGLGKYGENLAEEILKDYLRDVIADLHDAGLGLAATYLETKHNVERR